MKFKYKNRRTILKPNYTKSIIKLTKKNTEHNTGYKTIELVYDNRLHFANDHSFNSINMQNQVNEVKIKNEKERNDEQMKFKVKILKSIENINEQKEQKGIGEIKDNIEEGDIGEIKEKDDYEESESIERKKSVETEKSVEKETNKGECISEETNEDEHANSPIFDTEETKDEEVHAKSKEKTEVTHKNETKVSTNEIDDIFDTYIENNDSCIESKNLQKKEKRVTFLDKEFKVVIPPNYSNIVNKKEASEFAFRGKRKKVVVKRIFRRGENDLDLQFIFTTRNK